MPFALKRLISFFLFAMYDMFLLFLLLIMGVIWFNVQDPEPFDNRYTHTVNLPINDPVSCRNFCSPQSKCVITGEQCTADVDCTGCQRMETNKEKETKPFYHPSNNAGKGGQLSYSSLTTDFDDNLSSPIHSTVDYLVPSYQGIDKWTNSFNQGLKLYNQKQEIAEKYSTPNHISAPTYPTTVSMTGTFYETTPPPANA